MTDIGAPLYVDPERRAEFQRRIAGYHTLAGFESQVYRKDGSKEFESVTEYCIGRVYRWMGQTGPSLEHYRQSVALSRAVGKRRMEAYALMDVATIHTSMGDARRARGQYERALRLYKAIGDRRGQAKVLTSIGDTHYSAGAWDRALSYYERALPLYQSAKDSSNEASTLYGMARASRARGDFDAALADIESAINIVEFLRVQIASPALRSSYFASVRRHYGFYVDMLMQMHKMRPAAGFATEAFQASESARARVLLEILAESAVNIRQGVEPELLERERSLQQLLSAKALYQSRLLSGKETDESEEVAREIRRLTTEYQEVQAQIRERSPRYASLTQPQSPRLADIQRELPDGQTLLLEYALGDDRSYLWAVSSTSVESFELPARAAIEAAAGEFHSLLVARQPLPGETESEREARVTEADGRYNQSALKLSQMLLGPLAEHLGDKRLLIVPDGALQYIPFEALPIPRPGQAVTGGADNNFDDAAPIVSEHEVMNLPSASALAALRRDKLSPGSASAVVAVLADPVFEPDDPRVKAHTAPASNDPAAATETAALRDALVGVAPDRAARLPFTRLEAEEILSLTPAGAAMVATGFDANLAAATSVRLGQYQIVHFATHGVVNDKHPELSGIVLSLVDERGNPENGFLQLHDIYNLNLSAKLVVLSACDTGLGKEVNGEGLIGLTRGFMYAGAKSVLASLWKVDDRATAELMGHFYKAMLKDNLPPAAALRVAKEALRKQKRWRAPYYWAGFVLQGDYAERVNVDNTSRSSPYIIAASAILLAACASCGLYYMRRRRRNPAPLGS